jgi:acetyl esterase/lipase
VKRIIAWTRTHGQAYRVDPTVIFLAGSSAGAHLTAMAALTAGDPRFQPGFESADTSIAAGVGLYGYYGPLGSGEHPASTPFAYVDPAAPPFLVVHGDNDTYTAASDAHLFATGLRAVSSSPVVYAELPGAQHSFELTHSIRFEHVVNAIEAFAAWVTTQRTAAEGVGVRS